MFRGITVALLTLPASLALAEGRAVALKVGALGFGAEYTHELTDRWKPVRRRAPERLAPGSPMMLLPLFGVSGEVSRCTPAVSRNTVPSGIELIRS